MIETTKAQIEAARAHYPTDGLKGMSLDHAYGRQAAAMVAVVIAGSQILRLACKCAIILPDCPDFDQKPVMVPLAEIEFTGDDTIKTVEHVCMLKCRRLALTPRTMSTICAKPLRRSRQRSSVINMNTAIPWGRS